MCVQEREKGCVVEERVVVLVGKREVVLVEEREWLCWWERERERLSDIALGIFFCLSYETMLEFLKFYKASRMNPHIFYN